MAITGHGYTSNAEEHVEASGLPGIGTVGLIKRADNGVSIEDPTATATWYSGSAIDTDVLQMWGIRNVRGPQQQANPLNATHLNVQGGFAAYVPGLRDGGVIEFECNWNPDNLPWQDEGEQDGATHSIAQHPLNVDDALRLLCIKPAGMLHVWTAMGFITGLIPTYDTDNVVSAMVSFKVTGPVRMTSGTGSLAATLDTALL